MDCEYAFEMATANIRFGVGVTREVGMDLVDLGTRRAMVVTDANLAGLPPVAAVLESLRREKIEFSLFDRAKVEPTDVSFKEAIEFARSEPFDAFVAVGADLRSTRPRRPISTRPARPSSSTT